MLRFRPVATLVACVLAGALLFGGCGGSSSSTAPVRELADMEQVASTSAQASSARFTLEMEQSLGSQSFGFSAEGGFDKASQRAELTFDMSSFASLLSAFGGGKAPGELTDPDAWKLEAIQDGKLVYVRFPLIAKELPPGKTWIRGDLEQLAKQKDANLSQFGSFASTDPREALDALRALTGTLETVGRETVRGVETTHYRATLDPAKLAAAVGKQASADVLGSFQEAIASAGLASIPIDVWVDDDDLLRRYELKLTLSPEGISGSTTTSLRMELFDYGAPLELELPAADDVADVSELKQAP